MRKLQQFCGAVILTLAIALSAFAGDMSCPGITAEPPPPQRSSVTGDIGTLGVASTGDMGTPGVMALNPGTGIMLSLFQSVLSFF